MLIVGLAAVAVAGCDRLGLTATVAPASPSASAVATPSPTAAPSRSPNPAQEAVEAFVAWATAEEVSYRVDFEGRVSASVDYGKVTGRMDTSGRDWSMALTYDFSEQYPGIDDFKVQAREVEGLAYQRDDGEDWRRLRGYTSDTDSSLPFAPVASATDVQFVETVDEDGEVRHHVRIRGPVIVPPRTIPGFLTEERVRTSTLDLLITEDGLPVSGTWELDATGRVQGQLQHIIVKAELAFSRLGREFTIEKP